MHSFASPCFLPATFCPELVIYHQDVSLKGVYAGGSPLTRFRASYPRRSERNAAVLFGA